MAKAKKTSRKSTTKTSSVVDALKQVLADSYALMGQTHLCHWNVEGPSFFALHAAFEEQYTELFTAVDDIAERIRALGAYSPGGLANLAKLSGMKELKENAKADDMVKHLATLHHKLIKDAATARDLAGDSNDKETEDMMIARIEVHQKTVWMLESYLKG
jgi:starvation-inducible DNA-binding protein